MKDVSLKEKLRRGGAVLLVTMVCLTGLVGCGPEKPAAGGGGKPGSSQTDPNKKGGLIPGGKITDGKITGGKDAGSKDNGSKDNGSKDNGGKPKPPATGKAGSKGGN